MAVQWDLEAIQEISPRAVDLWPWSTRSVDPADAWNSLLLGEWVVAEHSAHGSARTLLALSAATQASQGALEPTEIHMATRRARGESIKSIAIDLGCSCACVSRCITSVMRKLKLRCQADLVVLLQGRLPWGLSASRAHWSGQDYLVFTYPAPFWPLPPCLTRAEQGIVLELVAGASQRAIARVRGTSVRTVANQVASIFRKLHVGSRVDLFVALRPA
jgi:DNA-binding NarL/FixJ family response regulator